MFNQEYLPCNRQIHIKLSGKELEMIRDRMEQMGFKNMSAYIRKMAIDGYCINVDFTAIHDLAKMMLVVSGAILDLQDDVNMIRHHDKTIDIDFRIKVM